MSKPNYIPEGRHTATPFLCVKDSAKAIEFYVKAFGAKEISRMTSPDGKSVMHAQIQIGDSTVCLSDENPQCGVSSPQTLGGVASTIYLYVPDTDASFKRAVEAGAEGKMPPADMFWGDRFAAIVDPFGHQWSFGTRVEELSFEEMTKRRDAFFKQMAGAAR
ncbi:MAG TPA: VOC family protein [Chroococcales cyanobacterium]